MLDETTAQCPTFLVRGDKIVEVAVTRWRGVPVPGGRRWLLDEPLELELTGWIDRMVVELPVGCFEQPMDDFPGTITLTPKAVYPPDDPGIARCQRRPAGFAQPEPTLRRRVVERVKALVG